MEPHCSLMFHLLKTPSPTVSAFPGLRSHPSLNAFPAPSRSLSFRTITCAPPNIICCFSDSVLVLVFQRTRMDMSTYVPLAPGSQLLPSGYLDTCMYLGKGVTEGGGWRGGAGRALRWEPVHRTQSPAQGTIPPPLLGWRGLRFTGGGSKWVPLKAATLSSLLMKDGEEMCPTHKTAPERGCAGRLPTQSDFPV